MGETDMLKKYDLMFVSKVDTEELYDELIEKYKKLILNGGGKILKADKWGRKNLATIVKGLKEGNFTRFGFISEGEVVRNIDKTLKKDKEILKFMIISDSSWGKEQQNGKIL